MSDSSLFRLFDLPIELQVKVMECDATITKNLIYTSPDALTVFVENSSTILANLLDAWPNQLRNLIIANIVVHKDNMHRTLGRCNLTLRDCIVPNNQLGSGMTTWRTAKRRNKAHLRSARKIITLFQTTETFRPIKFLNMLSCLMLSLNIGTEIFIKYTLKRAASEFKGPVIAGSTTEHYRIHRALLRSFLYGHPQVQRWTFPKRDLEEDVSLWEAEEIRSISVVYDHIFSSISDSHIITQEMRTGKLFFLETMVTALEFDLLHHTEPLYIWDDAGRANEMSHGFRYAQAELTDYRDASYPWYELFGFPFWDKERMDLWEQLPLSMNYGNSFELHQTAMVSLLASDHDASADVGIDDAIADLMGYIEQTR